jgi:hypothetical protein
VSSDDQPSLPSEEFEEPVIEELELPDPPDADDLAQSTMVLEMPEVPADEGASADEDEVFGGPEDESAEQPMLVVGSGSDEVPALGESEVIARSISPADAQAQAQALAEAYEYLEIRTPLQEYESYARARLEARVRVGDTDRAELTAAALKLGLDSLRRVMGALPREGAQ